MQKFTAKYETQLAINKDGQKAKKQTTKNAMERLVEDLIAESMAKGDFDNLNGAGKPLPQRVIYNPYEDFTTHKMNQILGPHTFAIRGYFIKFKKLEMFEFETFPEFTQIGANFY